MRLVTYEDPSRRFRVGAVNSAGDIVDLNSACALYLREVENEAAYSRLADALVPPNMRDLFAGGDTGLEAAQKAFDHALQREQGTSGPGGEIIFYSPDEVRIKAPITPKKFFHTAGNF